MTFRLSGEAQALVATAHRLMKAESAGWSDWRDAWKAMIAQGWPALLVPEEHQGLGRGGIDAALLAAACGEHLATAPFAETWAATAMLRRSADAGMQARILPRVATGALRIGLAIEDASGTEVRLSSSGSGTRVSGRKSTVRFADWADHFLVRARGQDGTPVICLVEAKHAEVKTAASFEGGVSGSVELRDAPAERVPAPDAERELALASGLFAAAEIGGIARLLVRTTIEHAKLRHQFGSALASMQVVRHRLVDMHIAAEKIGALVLRSADQLFDPPGHQRTLDLVAAHLVAGRAGRQVAKDALQLHGASGMIEGSLAGTAFTRIYGLSQACGGLDRQLATYARIMRQAGSACWVWPKGAA